MTDPLTETRDDGITPSLRSKAGEPRNGHTPSHSRLMRAHFADPEGGKGAIGSHQRGVLKRSP
jgi:hypothetical protein